MYTEPSSIIQLFMYNFLTIEVEIFFPYYSEALNNIFKNFYIYWHEESCVSNILSYF